VTTLRENAQIGIGGLRYLVILTVKDYSSASPPFFPAVDVELRFSNMPYTQRTTPASDHYYKPFDPRVIAPLNINVSMYDAGTFAGVVRPDSGTIELANADGALDYLLTEHSFDKKTIEIRMLRGISDTDEVEDHPLIFKGLTQTIAATEDSIEIVLGDNMVKLDRDFPPNVIDGQRIPIALGKVYNVEPILVDEAANEYQVHDGAVTSIDAVYVGGELQTLTTDYTVDAANGKFTMTSAPAGVVTADVTNDVTHGSYTNGAGVLLYEMATTYGALTTTGDAEIEDTTYTTAAANAYEHGIYVAEKTTLIQPMNEILQSVNGILFQNGATLDFALIENPTSASGTDPITDDDIIDIEIIPTSIYQSTTVVMNYKRNYRVLTESELGTIPDDREFATKEWRSDNAGILVTKLIGSFSGVRDVLVNSTITNFADANVEASKRAAFYANDNKIYRVRMKLNPLYLNVGGACEIRCSRFGLSSGKYFLILSKFEDLEVNEVTLEVWG